jgi:hypothetical protein
MLKKQRITLAWLGEKEWLALLLWFGLSLIVAVKEVAVNNYNNFTIFRHVFLHVINQQPLYLAQPETYFDVNYYGPVFSLLIAPFAWMPVMLGGPLWVMANALFLYFAIRQLPITRIQQNLVLIFASHELMAASSYFQFNPSVAACIILSFSLILKGKDFWAAFFIMLATLVKIYGIVGLAFFFFSAHRWRFIGSMLFWALVLGAAPMLISSPSFIVDTYKQWWEAILRKDKLNINFDNRVALQDISAMGMIRRIFHLTNMPNWVVIVPGMVLFALQYLQISSFRNYGYRIYILCSTLLFVVLFSTGSESPTYIIAFPAICIWYLLQQPARWKNIFFIFALIGTSFSHSDLVTSWVKYNLVVPYALKALPSLLMWLIIVYEIFTQKYLRLARH